MARPQRRGDLVVELGSELGALEQEQPGRRPAELAGDHQELPGPGARAADEPARIARSDHRHSEQQGGRRGDVATGDRDPMQGRHLRQPIGELEQLGFAAVLRHAELDVGLARFGPHRREVRQRHREPLSAHLPQAERRDPEVDALHQRVDSGHAGAVADRDRRIVAAAEHERGRDVGRAGEGDPLADRRDQLELIAHVDIQPRRRGQGRGYGWTPPLRFGSTPPSAPGSGIGAGSWPAPGA